jgi:hypothetical protein
MTDIEQTLAEIRRRDDMYPTQELTAGAVADRRTLLHIIDEYRERLYKINDLFSGGPDTVCRTTWRHGDSSGAAIECVEVPLEDLREALS